MAFRKQSLLSCYRWEAHTHQTPSQKGSLSQNVTNPGPSSSDTVTLSAPWWQMAAKAQGPPPASMPRGASTQQLGKWTSLYPNLEVLFPHSCGVQRISAFWLPLPPDSLSSCFSIWPPPCMAHLRAPLDGRLSTSRRQALAPQMTGRGSWVIEE